MTQVINHNDTFTVPGQGSMAKSGHTFLGWNSSANGDGAWILAGTDYIYNADITLYAFWSDGSVLFLENFESPVVSGYAEQTYPSTTSWIQATSGFGAKYSGLINTDSGDYTDSNPISQQGLFLRYNNNTGLTTAEGEITTLDSAKTYTVSFDVIKSSSGRNYDAELIAFAPGASRTDAKVIPAGSVRLANSIGQAPDDGSAQTISMTIDMSNYLPEAGKDFALRFKGTGSDAVIDNVRVVEASSSITYSVTYMGNGSDGGLVPMDPNAYYHGNSVTVLSNGSLTRSGYNFIGWNTAVDRSGDSYIAGDTFNISGDVMLYAQWVQTYEGWSAGAACGPETTGTAAPSATLPAPFDGA